MKKLRNYVVDDGWNLLENVFEDIDLCICRAKDKELLALLDLKVAEARALILSSSMLMRR